MLKVNQVYLSAQIKQHFGGSIIPCMPIVGGRVPYCKFDPKINPNFASNKEAWIECGPIRKRGLELVLQTGEKIPVFQKEGTGRWKYLGRAVASDATTSIRLNTINRRPPREKIQRIIAFKF